MTIPQTAMTKGSNAAMANGPIPLELLAREVYDEATPTVQQRMRALLVGKVFESATPDARRTLVTQLMAPLGILSLVAVADGIFANIRLRGGLSDASVMMDGLQNIQSRSVVDLAMHAQQVNLEVLDKLAPMLSTSSLLATSAAAVLLLQILERRPRKRSAI